jgi:ADP-heptose:LPS heptosyltransferase
VSAVSRLRRLRIGAVIDLEFFARSSAILSYLSGASVRVGLHSYSGEGPYRGDLMTHRLVFNPYLHTSELFALMVEALNHPPSAFPAFAAARPVISLQAPAFQPSASDLDSIRRLLSDCGAGNAQQIVLMSTNCSDMLPLRRWGVDRYATLAARLLAALPDAHVVLTGAPDEADAAREVTAKVASPRCVSVAGQTTLSQLLALFSISRVLVTNDSGPAHFATMTRINVVTLFGPETPQLFAARTPRNHVIWAGLPCSPCINAYNNRESRCRDNLCMQHITVDEVFDAAVRAFGTYGGDVGVGPSAGE